MDLARRLRNGETVISAWSGIPEPLVAEIIAGLGFDAVTLDMQHGGHDEASVLRSIGPIVAKGVSSIVRIPIGRFDMASRALDMGAQGVIAPMINTIEDAKDFAAAMKFPPVGERSWGPRRALALRGIKPREYLESANADTLAVAMIETRQALALVGDILEIDGIDAVMVGPSDFSIAWTEGNTVDPGLQDMMEAIGKIADAARKREKIAGIFLVNPALGGRMAKMGFNFMAIGNEDLAEGAQSLLANVRKSIA